MCVPTTVYNRGTQYSTEQLRQSSLSCPRQSSQYRWRLLEGRGRPIAALALQASRCPQPQGGPRGVAAMDLRAGNW